MVLRNKVVVNMTFTLVDCELSLDLRALPPLKFNDTQFYMSIIVTDTPPGTRISGPVPPFFRLHAQACTAFLSICKRKTVTSSGSPKYPSPDRLMSKAAQGTIQQYSTFH